jgi:hypothetical protein
VLEVALEAIDQIGKHVVGIAVDRVGDVFLRDAVLLGQALQDLAQLGLGLALVGLELLEMLPGTAAVALERSPARGLGQRWAGLLRRQMLRLRQLRQNAVVPAINGIPHAVGAGDQAA